MIEDEMKRTTNTTAGIDMDAAQLDKLEALARAATPGPWMRLFGERTVYDRMEDGCRGNTIVRADTSYSSQDAANLDFIAAANPATVLQLIQLARRSTTANECDRIGHAFETYSADGKQRCVYCREEYNASKASRSDGTAAAGRMTEHKTKEIEREGMARTGYVLQGTNGRACIVHQGAVRWLSNTELWNVVHPAATSGSELAPDERALFEAAMRAEHGEDLTREDLAALWSELPCYAWRRSRSAHAQQAVAPAGYKLVPIDPKAGAMLHMAWLSLAGEEQPRCTDMCRIYDAMLAAAASSSAEDDQVAKDAERWSKEPPTEQGEYWNWDGDEDHAPMIYHVLWSGTAKKCFVSRGQYDIELSIWCDEFGGWWLPIEQPSTRGAAMSQAKGAGKEGLRDERR